MGLIKVDEIYDKFMIRAKELCAKLTMDEKLGLLTTHQNAVERLGIPDFRIGCEVARGYVGRDTDHISTVFPQPIGLAGTFDRELMGKLGEIAGTEARAYYNRDKNGSLHLWGPTVDMVRNPLWGRTEEAYGEDPCLSGELSAAYTLGMAGENIDGYYKTIPTLKHFCANNNEENRGSCNAFLTPRQKREYYYAPFENAVKNGGARSLMTAYNELNGCPGIMNTDLNDVVKKEWGLWFTVSDGGDFSQNVMSHRYTETNSEAYKYCIQAGSDLMTDEENLVKAAALQALEQGLISENDIDKVVTDILYARIRLGELDKTEFDDIGTDSIDTLESRKVNLRAALEQVTLLKNNGVLPVKDTHATVSVLGPLADEILMDWYTGYASYENTIVDGIREHFSGKIIYDSLWDRVAVKCGNGKYLCAYEDGSVRADAEEICDGAVFELQDWGENWKNLLSNKYKRFVRLMDDGKLGLHKRRIYDWFTRETFNFSEYGDAWLIEELLNHRRLGIDDSGESYFTEERAAGKEFLFTLEMVSPGRDRAKNAANDSDYVIYCSGNYPVQTAKECYDRKTLALNIQQGMTEYISGINKNTILTIVSSYPYSIVEESKAAAAVLYTSHAGAELGTAVALTISGRNNPSGHLALTWYRSEKEIPNIMNYDIESSGATYMYFKGEPLYPFGFGLSYSEFEFGALKMESDSGKIFGKISVKNTSDIPGTTVVQLYYTLKDSAVLRPDKKLCGFERAELKAGEEKEIVISVNTDMLKIFDVRSGKMMLEEGDYCFMAGKSSADMVSENTIHIEGEKPGMRESKFYAAMYDKIDSARLFYSKNELKEYVRITGWKGSVAYTGVDLKAAKRLKFRASSVIGDRKLSVLAGSDEYECEINASDAYDDFKEYTIELKNGTAKDELVFVMPQYVGLMDIEVL